MLNNEIAVYNNSILIDFFQDFLRKLIRSVMDVMEESPNCASRATKLKEKPKASAASLSFSIARLIAGNAETSAPPPPPPAPPAVPAVPQPLAALPLASAANKNPLYPIPMWAPVTSSAFPAYGAALPASAYSDPGLNAMLRHVLHSSGFPNDTVTALVRHYQTLYGGGATAAAVANLHKVEILRSAAIHHQQQQQQQQQLGSSHHQLLQQQAKAFSHSGSLT